MKIQIAILAAAFAVVLLAIQMPRAIGAEELNAHQQRMKSCNGQADTKALEGAERNHFMRACLKGASGNGHKVSVRQQRSEECTRQARAQGLEGAERRGFMSECEQPPVKQQSAENEKMKACQRRAKERRLDAEETRNYVNGCATGSAAGKSS
jgi:hypothetical protein